jgi:hypothetical protein
MRVLFMFKIKIKKDKIIKQKGDPSFLNQLFNRK